MLREEHFMRSITSVLTCVALTFGVATAFAAPSNTPSCDGGGEKETKKDDGKKSFSPECGGEGKTETKKPGPTS